MTSHKSFIVGIGYYQKLFSYHQLDTIGIYGSISLVLMVSIISNDSFHGDESNIVAGLLAFPPTNHGTVTRKICISQ